MSSEAKIGGIFDIHAISISESFADTPWTAYGQDEYRIFSNADARLTAALNYFQAQGITCAFQGGDYVNGNIHVDGQTMYISRLQTAETIRSNSNYTGSFYHVIGNHEYALFDSVNWDNYADNITNSAITDAWTDDGISKGYCFEDSGIRYIVLFSYLTTAMGESQLAWLENTALDSSLPKVVIVHSHIANWEYGAATYVPLSNRAAIRTILENDGNVQAVIQGHWHVAENYELLNGIHYIACRGSVLSDSLGNTSNNAYYVFSITPNAIYDTSSSRKIANIKVEAFGMASNDKDYTSYLVA